MVIAFKILILVGFIKILLVIRRPLIIALIYTAVSLLFSFLMGMPVGTVLVKTVIVFALSVLYFSALNFFYNKSILFWIILLIGAAASLA